jgi:hypothetical protein
MLVAPSRAAVIQGFCSATAELSLLYCTVLYCTIITELPMTGPYLGPDWYCQLASLWPKPAERQQELRTSELHRAMVPADALIYNRCLYFLS